MTCHGLDLERLVRSIVVLGALCISSGCGTMWMSPGCDDEGSDDWYLDEDGYDPSNDFEGISCEQSLEERSCGRDYVQYCSWTSSSDRNNPYVWGPCLSVEELICEMGEEIPCSGASDPSYDYCVLTEGIPSWRFDGCEG